MRAAFATTWIDFAGISSISSLPINITYPGGTVTVSQASSPVAGSATLSQYVPGVGNQGSESPTGGLLMGISDTGSSIDTWEVQMVFSQPQFITINNTETYTNFEDTILTSQNPWTQVNGSSLLNVSGLGSDTISLVGINGPTGPFGYGHWSTTTTQLDMTYLLDETAGGTAGNGIEIAVPEPASVSVFGLACAGLLARRRIRRAPGSRII